MSRRITIEICVGDVESAIAAEVGGADRVELCDNLSVGGTTPSAGTIAEACRWLSIPVHVLIRPRAGDFVYSERELAVMRHDIEAAKALGAAGVVLGVLTREGRLEHDQVSSLVAMARPLSVTFHRAIDQAGDPLEVLDALVAIGADRVLTSGGRPTALEGVEALKTLVDRGGDRIAVMAGGRLDLESLEPVIRRSRVVEVHLGSAVVRPAAGPEPPRAADGSETSWNRVDAQRVAAVVAMVQGVFGTH
ncbi:MAG: copper homeostasis protein CutC [Isosphaeraceae bacterium]